MPNNSPLNIKLNLTIAECNNKINQLYSFGYSQAKIADIFNVNRTTIERYFKRNNLKSRRFDDRPLAIKHCALSENDIEIINGLMLGDGCISKTSKLSARLVFSGNNLRIIEEALPNLIFNKCEGTLINKPPGSLNFKKYKYYRMKSHSYAELLEIRNKWYIDKKIIPQNLILTPTVCYWWFIGDGCCTVYKNTCRVFLCTECFTLQENQYLVNQFKKLGINSIINNRNRIIFCKTKNKKQYVKYTNKNVKYYDYTLEGNKFLNYIKDLNIHSEYFYKFKPIMD